MAFRMPENHGSDDPIELSEDNKAAALKAIKDAHGNLAFIHEMIGKDALTVGIRFSCLANAESHMRRTGQLLDAGKDKAQTSELNKSQLRIANDEIARLRKEMAKGVTLESVGNKLEVLNQIVRKWWHQQGFGLAEGKFRPNYRGADYEVDFSTYISDRDSSLIAEDEPVTAEQRHQERLLKIAEGGDLIQDHHRQPALKDTPKSRAWLDNLITTRFPGTRIWEYTAQYLFERPGEYQIRKVIVHIPIEAITDA